MNSHRPLNSHRLGIDLSLTELLELRFAANNLSLAALKQTQQMRQGMHRSRQLGRGMEFVEVRHYQPGDDVRAIDWKITARSNKPHTKLFQEERLQEVYLVVDRQHSMRFGTAEAFKSVIAGKVAALLAFVAANHGDAVGGIVVDDEGLTQIQPQARNTGALTLCHALTKNMQGQSLPQSGVDSSPNSSLVLALQHLFSAAKLHSLVVICSDFAPLSQELHDAIAVLGRRHQVLAIIINDRLERELPEAGLLSFSDQERRLSLDSSNPQQRANYQRHFAARRKQLLDFLAQTAVPWLQLDTSNAWKTTLIQALAQQRGGH